MSVAGPQHHRYSIEDYYQYYEWSKNKSKRFKSPYESNVAYALVKYTREGRPAADQFYFPYVSNSKYPRVKRLEKISFGLHPHTDAIEALTMDDDEEMTTQRSIHIEAQFADADPVHYQLFFFSPTSSYTRTQNLALNKSEPDLSSTASTTSTTSTASAAARRGGKLIIKHSTIASPRRNPLNMPSQFEVMGYSALSAFKRFRSFTYKTLTSEMDNILLKAIQASDPRSKTSPLSALKLPEWCHALGKQFFPKPLNAQTRNNIGAAPFWMNSQMLAVEEPLRWHAEHYPEAEINLKSHFTMFNNSDVIKEGEMEGTLKFGQMKVKVKQRLNPHQLFPSFPQVTDAAIATFVINSLLSGRVPDDIIVENHASLPKRVTPLFDVRQRSSSMSRGDDDSLTSSLDDASTSTLRVKK